MRKEVVITVFYEESAYELPTTPDAFMEYWQEKFDRVPEEFRGTTEVSIEANNYYDSAQLELKVTYRRLETDEEAAQREAREALKLSEQEKQDRKRLAELKAKYGES